MERKNARSTQTLDAVAILGVAIARARRERRRLIADVAERAGVSVPTIRRVERGDPSVAIGTVFEVAAILGLDLVGAGGDHTTVLENERNRLALLPARVRASRGDIDDAF